MINSIHSDEKNVCVLLAYANIFNNRDFMLYLDYAKENGISLSEEVLMVKAVTGFNLEPLYVNNSKYFNLEKLKLSSVIDEFKPGIEDDLDIFRVMLVDVKTKSNHRIVVFLNKENVIVRDFTTENNITDFNFSVEAVSVLFDVKKKEEVLFKRKDLKHLLV